MNEPAGECPWHFENQQVAVRFDERRIRDFLAALADDVAEGGAFAVAVSSDRAVRDANRRYRGVDQVTDVLSFADGEVGYLGDILIAAARAARQAAEHGHSIEEEIQTLALHGMLHLRGLDHETDNGEMRAEEERWRRQYGLPPGLVARAAWKPQSAGPRVQSR